ncbi:MAG: hypothetical protein KC549_07020 [Myxococcales bacterium]|nr:hypothetical protein [Myxococcales bacterium]MCB9547278.1 hypothetical protein [Myxococcales bacterium]
MKRALIIAALLTAGGAVAQPAPDRTARKKQGVVQIEALKVEGVVQKPEAFYILQRSELNFKGLEPRKSFIPLILKSVEKDPF